MTALQSLKARAGLLAAGGLSFLAALAIMRASSGEPLIQPSADLGVAIGIAMVALLFVVNDTRGSAEK